MTYDDLTDNLAFMITGDKISPIDMTDEQALNALAEVLGRLQSAPESIRAQARDLIAEYAISARPVPEATEAEKQARIWGKQKAMHQALIEALMVAESKRDEDKRLGELKGKHDHTINVWRRGDADVRVYIDEAARRNAWKVCYYVTGNAHNPPGSLKVDAGWSDPTLIALGDEGGEEQEQLTAFCKAVADNWRQIKSESAVSLKASVEPCEDHLDAYRVALGLKEAESKDNGCRSMPSSG